jgi:peptidoglycan/LPS O-acetylase OafA/YrhL
VVIFSILVIGPINTSLSLQEYFLNINTWMYSEAILIFTQKSLALKNLQGVFMSNTFHEINGSLWTVPLEFRMYIILCIRGVIGMLKDRRVLLSIVMLSCVIYLHNLLPNVWALNICATVFGYVGITGYLSLPINHRIPINLSSYNPLFLIGMLFYLYSASKYQWSKIK